MASQKKRSLPMTGTDSVDADVVDGGSLGAGSPTIGWLGRVPVGAKLAATLAVTLLATLAPWQWTGLVITLALAAAAASSRIPAASILRPVLPAIVGVILVSAYHLIWTGTAMAVRVGGLLLALAVTGGLLLASTPVEATIAWTVSAAQPFASPLARLRLTPALVGTAIGLTIASIPALTDAIRSVRAAAAARGIRSARIWLVPVVVRTITRAHSTAEALVARAIVDEPHQRAHASTVSS